MKYPYFDIPALIQEIALFRMSMHSIAFSESIPYFVIELNVLSKFLL